MKIKTKAQDSKNTKQIPETNHKTTKIPKSKIIKILKMSTNPRKKKHVNSLYIAIMKIKTKTQDSKNTKQIPETNYKTTKHIRQQKHKTNPRN